jgi:hypothetical protein
LKGLRKVVLYSCLFFVGLPPLALVSFRLWLRYEYRLPPEQRVRERFENNRADYVQFVRLLQRDKSADFIESDGTVGFDGTHRRLVPEYRDLIRRIGAKDVIIREDGSVEFALYGFGCAICSDSYMGVLYAPKVGRSHAHAGWEQTAVTSVDSAKLPQQNGGVASGLYVVPIEPEWFIYRLEYQE